MFKLEFGEKNVTLKCSCGEEMEISELALQKSPQVAETGSEERAERKLDEIAEAESRE